MNFQVLAQYFARKFHKHDNLASWAGLEAVAADIDMSKSDINHNHDDTYYTETETDALLAGKSDVGHIHDNRYYTESELNGGQLDNRYYTESEVNALLASQPQVADLPYFKARKLNGQSLAAATWTTVVWDTLEYNYHSPQFSVPNNRHEPTAGNNTGVWFYELNLAVISPMRIFVQFLIGSTPIAVTDGDNGFAHLTATNGIGSGNQVSAQIWAESATSLDIQLKNCHFAGYRIPPPFTPP